MVQRSDRLRSSAISLADSTSTLVGLAALSSHAAWVADTHHRQGEKALLQYNVAKSANDDGSLTYVLSEVYETGAGLQDHIEQANSNWETFADFGQWLSQCQVTGGGLAVIHSLW